MQKFFSADDVQFVNDLVIEAGNMALSLQPKQNQGLYLCDNNSGLTVDEKISCLLVDKIRNRFKNHLVISEENLPEQFLLDQEFVWLIDPIDGTNHYLTNDSQYSIMLGLLHFGKPMYGWVYNPAFNMLYYGGADSGIWSKDGTSNKSSIQLDMFINDDNVRLILGKRDYKDNPWLKTLPNSTIIEAGSIGYKISRILENEADVFLHLAGRLKVWDTAGPVALSLAAGLEIGSSELDYLNYPQDSFLHPLAIIIGKKGSLKWFRSKVIPLWIK